MNKIIVTGRICNDLELRYTASDKEYCGFSLAVPRDKEHTDFIRVATFGGTAKLINDYCKKGDKILVEGSLTTSQYEKDGHKVYDVSIMANRIEFLEQRREETQEIKRVTQEQDPFEEMARIVGADKIDIQDSDLPF